jgi:hypothetical protein
MRRDGVFVFRAKSFCGKFTSKWTEGNLQDAIRQVLFQIVDKILVDIQNK